MSHASGRDRQIILLTHSTTAMIAAAQNAALTSMGMNPTLSEFIAVCNGVSGNRKK